MRADDLSAIAADTESLPRIFSSDEQRLALALGRYLAATIERLAPR